MASDQVDVSDEGRLVLELSDIHVEEVDSEGRRQDVGHREDHGEEWNVCQESHVVSMPEVSMWERYVEVLGNVYFK